MADLTGATTAAAAAVCVVPSPTVHAPTHTHSPSGLLMAHVVLTLAVKSMAVWHDPRISRAPKPYRQTSAKNYWLIRLPSTDNFISNMPIYLLLISVILVLS